MPRRELRTGAITVTALAWAFACGGGDGGGSNGSSAGGSGNTLGADYVATCSSDDDCASSNCVDGRCAPGTLLAPGAACRLDAECTTGSCDNGVCTVDECDQDQDCPSGRCVDGVCAGVVIGGGAPWIGGGTGYRPLTTGCGPETAASCTGACESGEGNRETEVVRPHATLCFAGEGDPTPEDPSAVIEQVIESVNGEAYVHLRVTFDPAFVDNTYGENASEAWTPEDTGDAGDKKPGGKGGHTFKDLVGSDHTELLLTNGNAETVMEMKLDLISESDESACGYETLGVSGGDGKMITGDASAVLAVATSMSRNLNGCGYCAEDACNGDCTVDSPATDAAYTPNDDTPKWDYRQVYETWVALDAFGSTGFGQAYVTYVHASPSTGTNNTLIVEPSPCPPDWCVGPGCYGGTGGAGGTGGTVGVGGGSADCGPNEQIYTAPDGSMSCTPIPFANYPGMAACPDGWVLDTASEGRFCVPAT